jgi:hypothetical protein
VGDSEPVPIHMTFLDKLEKKGLPLGKLIQKRKKVE